MDWTKSGPTFYFFFDNIFHSDVCHNAEEITYRYFRFIATLKKQLAIVCTEIEYVHI